MEDVTRGGEPTTTGGLPRTRRLIGSYEGDRLGPTLIVIGSIHGNEPAGSEAARRVMETLAERKPASFRGYFLAVVGNTRALYRGVRYLEDDLNRMWTRERVRMLRAATDPDKLSPEEQELHELVVLLDEVRSKGADPTYLLDLHTTSAGGAPFATVGDTLRNRKFALHFPVTLILGLEEQLDGPLLEWMNNRGVITMGFEGGQHEAKSSVEHHEALLWLTLVATGMLARDDVPGYDAYRRRLREARGKDPRVVEVRYRHAITARDGFHMRPGYTNFQAVARDEVLAQDRRGEVRAPEDGLMLMPLYQGLGEDGFFLARKVSRNWFRLSTLLRRMRVHRIMHLLPGVWRHPEDPQTLIVNTNIARFYPLEVFHLLGFRKRRQVGPVLTVTKRRYDD